MPNRRILVVDDEQDIQELLRHHLTRERYRVVCAESGEKALELAMGSAFDAVILDIMLPGIDGFEVIKKLKAHSKTRSLPVLMLSARSEDADIVAGLELGAEDYVIKPFSPQVLVCRLKAVLCRRFQESCDDIPIIRIPDIQIHPRRREVVAGNRSIELTASEFSILQLLAHRPGWVFSRAQILDSLRGDTHTVNERSVDYMMAGLRRKLGPHGERIETVRGVGYRVPGNACAGEGGDRESAVSSLGKALSSSGKRRHT
jgi:two-component system phosphate regulon response regulator PhoB